MADVELVARIAADDQATATLRRVGQEAAGLTRQFQQLGVSGQAAGAGAGAAATAMGRAGQAAATAQPAVGGLSAGLSVLEGVSTAVSTALLGLAHQALAAVGDATVGLNSRLEQAGIAFETMLGSATQAQAFLGQLADFAARTPFEFPDLVRSSRTMLAMGFAAEQVIPTLTAVGNAAAALGASPEVLQRITFSLGQMQTQGRATGEELRELSIAGIQIWPALARVLGTDVAGAMAQVEARTVSADTVMRAFFAATAQFGGMMERQSHTFAGAMSTIHDVLTMTLAGALQPFYAVLRQGADNLAQWLQTPAFTTWAREISTRLAELRPLAERLFGWLGAQGPAALSAVTDGVSGLVGGLTALGDALGPLLAPLRGVWDALSAVSAATRTLEFGALERLGAVLSGLGSAVSETFGPILQDALARLSGAEVGGATDALDALGDALGALGAQAGAAWQSFQIAAVDAYNAVAPRLDDLRTWLGAHLGPALETLRATWEGFWSHAGPLVSAMWGVVGPALAALAGMLAALESNWLAALWRKWTEVWDGLIGVVRRVLPVLQAAAGVLGGAMAAGVDQLTAALQGMAPQVAEAATATTAELAQVRQEAIQGTAPALAAVAASGEQAGQGLAATAEGGQAAAPALTTTATAADKAKTALEAHNAAVRTWLQSTDPAIVAAGLWAQQVDAAAQAYARLHPAVAAAILAARNSGDTERTLAALMAATQQTRAAVIAGIQAETLAHEQNTAAVQRAVAAQTRLAGRVGYGGLPGAGGPGPETLPAGYGAFGPQYTGNQAGPGFAVPTGIIGNLPPGVQHFLAQRYGGSGLEVLSADMAVAWEQVRGVMQVMGQEQATQAAGTKRAAAAAQEQTAAAQAAAQAQRQEATALGQAAAAWRTYRDAIESAVASLRDRWQQVSQQAAEALRQQATAVQEAMGQLQQLAAGQYGQLVGNVALAGGWTWTLEQSQAQQRVAEAQAAQYRTAWGASQELRQAGEAAERAMAAAAAQRGPGVALQTAGLGPTTDARQINIDVSGSTFIGADVAYVDAAAAAAEQVWDWR